MRIGCFRRGDLLVGKSPSEPPSQRAINFGTYILKKSVDCKATGVIIQQKTGSYLLSFRMEGKWVEVGNLSHLSGSETLIFLENLVQPSTETTETIDYLYKERTYRFTAEFKKTEQGTSVELTRVGNDA